MRNPSIFLGITVLVATLLLIIFGITALSPVNVKRDNGSATNSGITPVEKPTVVFGNPVRGEKDAKITIVVFGDFLCEPCTTIDISLQKILQDFPGKVRYIWKDFPNTTFHKDAMDAAIAARCAQNQNAFWEYHDLLLTNQASINSQAYSIFAAKLNLNTSSFQQCLDAKTTQPIVEKDLEEGLGLNIDATPYLFIDNRRVSGALEYQQLHDIVAAALEKIGQPSKK